MDVEFYEGDISEKLQNVQTDAFEKWGTSFNLNVVSTGPCITGNHGEPFKYTMEP